jgi:hypothetical protein
MLKKDMDLVFEKYDLKNAGEGRNQVDVAFIKFCYKFFKGNSQDPNSTDALNRLYGIRQFENIVFGTDGLNGFHKKKGGYCYRNYKLLQKHKKFYPLSPFSQSRKLNTYDQVSNREQRRSIEDDNFSKSENNQVRLFNLLYIIYITYETEEHESRNDLSYFAQDTFILDKFKLQKNEGDFVHALSNLALEYMNLYPIESLNEYEAVEYSYLPYKSPFYRHLSDNLKELIESYENVGEFVADYGFDLLPESKQLIIKHIIEDSWTTGLEFKLNQSFHKFSINKFIHENNINSLLGKPVSQILERLDECYKMDVIIGLYYNKKYTELTKEEIIEKLLIGQLTTSLTSQEKTLIRTDDPNLVLYKYYKDIKTIFNIQSAEDLDRQYRDSGKSRSMPRRMEMDKNNFVFLQFESGGIKFFEKNKEILKSLIDSHAKSYRKNLLNNDQIQTREDECIFDDHRFKELISEKSFEYYKYYLLIFLKAHLTQAGDFPENYTPLFFKELGDFQDNFWKDFYFKHEKKIELKEIYFNPLFALDLLYHNVTNENDLRLLMRFVRIIRLRKAATAILLSVSILAEHYSELLEASKSIHQQNIITYGF